MRQYHFIAVAALALTFACKKEEPPPASEPAAIEEPAPAPVAAASAEPEVEFETLPTAEDFEEQAERQITAANLEQELDALEKEILAE